MPFGGNCFNFGNALPGHRPSNNDLKDNYIEAQNTDTQIEHEASTSRIAEEQLFYLQQRGIEVEEAIALMVNGFCKEVFNELPLEFASEADRLLSLKLEGSVG